MAISGMIELLTSRRARGWVRDGDDPRAPLMVRAREGEKLWAEAALACEPAVRPTPIPRQLSRAGQSAESCIEFCVEFPGAPRHATLARLTIEAARPGSDDWRALPRHPFLWSPPAQSTAPLAANWQGRGEKGEEQMAQTRSFWSDAATAAPIDWADSRPVFVIGPVRSGTTALCLALEKGTRYQGFPEGHVLDVAIRLVNAINLHFEKKEAAAGPDLPGYHLGHTHHARFFSEAIEMVRRLGSGYTTPFWFDKTPTHPMVASVPIIAEAWPHARFIFMKRRGLESMRSRLRKFSNVDFRGSCSNWASILAGWRNARETVPGRFIEIDQRDLEDSPETTGAAVGELLGLDPAEAEAFAKVLRSERPEATGPSSRPIADPAELGWTEEQMGIFREVCGAEMDAYGYTYDGRYRH